MIDLQATFANILSKRKVLDSLDEELQRVIRHVESTLLELRPGVPVDIAYKNKDGEEQWLSFGKSDGRWQIIFAYEEDGKDTPLLSAPRGVRAEVFDVTADTDGNSPLELLMLEVADAIEYYTKERGPLVERARALSAALVDLGYQPPQ